MGRTAVHTVINIHEAWDMLTCQRTSPGAAESICPEQRG